MDHNKSSLTSSVPGWAASSSSENAPASRRAAPSSLSPSDSASSSAASRRTSFENSPMFEELRQEKPVSVNKIRVSTSRNFHRIQKQVSTLSKRKFEKLLSLLRNFHNQASQMIQVQRKWWIVIHISTWSGLLNRQLCSLFRRVRTRSTWPPGP